MDLIQNAICPKVNENHPLISQIPPRISANIIELDNILAIETIDKIYNSFEILEASNSSQTIQLGTNTKYTAQKRGCCDQFDPTLVQIFHPICIKKTTRKNIDLGED